MSEPQTRIRIEPNPKWIRGVHGGRTLVDSKDSRLVWEVPYYPAWYFPVDAVQGDLVPNGEVQRSPRRGDGTRYDLVVDGVALPDVGWQHVDSPVEELRGLVRFEWDAMEAWFEENTEVFVHPRSPEVRIDTLPSSRRVRVLVDDEVIAESDRPTLLFETGLPIRYYLPQSDVRMEMLTPTGSRTGCPYKGFARYWNVTTATATHDDLAWGYPTPLPESEGVAGMVCFYNEKVDLEIDGVRLERAHTKFS